MSLQSAASAVIDSWISDCHTNNGDSQGVVGWNGPGPFLIKNNRIEGGHMGVFFGVLLVGFAYLWRRGDIDWVRSTAAERLAGAQPPPAPAPPPAPPVRAEAPVGSAS